MKNALLILANVLAWSFLFYISYIVVAAEAG